MNPFLAHWNTALLDTLSKNISSKFPANLNYSSLNLLKSIPVYFVSF